MNHFEEIKVLWTAPITKFYTNFVSYIAFLSFFTLAVMWPTCGNLLLDCFVWFWAASIAFENTRVAYEKYCVGNRILIRLRKDLFLFSLVSKQFTFRTSCIRSYCTNNISSTLSWC
jgi:hypothetical protein